MSDQEQNLKVLTDHVLRLARDQAAAAGRIKVANEAAAGMADGMWSTHGVVCAATNLAVTSARDARARAGDALYKVSDELATRLKNAADNYNEVDFWKGRDIGACSV